MGKIRVWTKQNKKIQSDLETEGRYLADRNFIQADMEDTSQIVLPLYDWLSTHVPKKQWKPADASYLIWVSFAKEATMLSDEKNMVLELEIEEEIITKIDIHKWGCILNYSYIPENEADKVRHQALLNRYHTNDVKAYMTAFYPQIKEEIVGSWERLFDTHISMGGDATYGTIWEVKREWVKKIIN